MFLFVCKSCTRETASWTVVPMYVRMAQWSLLKRLIEINLSWAKQKGVVEHLACDVNDGWTTRSSMDKCFVKESDKHTII